MKNRNKKNRKGFSLIEMLVSMFIMVTIVMAVTAVFAKSYSARKKAKEAQQNLEGARTAIETIAKNMRMSTKTRQISGSDGVEMYNNSQNTCIRYNFSGGNLSESRAAVVADKCDDAGTIYSSVGDLIKGGVSGGFRVDQTDTTSGSKKVGRGTIRIMMVSQTLQTTVSFRDYQEVIQ